MYRRILVPVSGPGEVEPLVRFGAMLLDADGEIRILHVIPGRSLPEVTRAWRSSMEIVVPAHEAGAALDVRVDPEVRAATDVAGEILEASETREFDALLFTLRADRRERNPFIGHTASALLHHAACDVVVVNRLALAEDHVARVLLPSLGPAPPPKALRLAEEIAVHHGGAPIVTLQLAVRGGALPTEEPPPPHTARGVPLLHRRSFFSAALLGRRRRLPELILAEAARERYGLLVVGESPDSPEGTILTRPFLDELFRNAPCPVVALRS